MRLFIFPWPPGQEPVDSPRVQAIAQAAQALVAKRDAWLNPRPEGSRLSDKELQKPTLTNLSNARPTWLDAAVKVKLFHPLNALIQPIAQITIDRG